MRERERFGDILERTLAASEPPTPLRLAQAATAPPPFPLLGGPTWFPGRPARPAPVFTRTVYGASAPGPANPPRTPARLSTSERRAADELRRLGAVSLGDEFSRADVKRAYRVLARRFHPDAHPWASDAERAYLADAFGRITAAYHELTHAGPSETSR
jgi:hypothetical protein